MADDNGIIRADGVDGQNPPGGFQDPRDQNPPVNRNPPPPPPQDNGGLPRVNEDIIPPGIPAAAVNTNAQIGGVDLITLLRSLSDQLAQRNAETHALNAPMNHPAINPIARNLLPSLDEVATPTAFTPEALYEEIRQSRVRETQFQQTINNLKSQMHRATSSAPDIDRVLEDAQRTPFTKRISGASMSHAPKIKIPTYDGVTPGTTDPIGHLTTFTIATGRARLPEDEKDAILCQLFVEKLSGAALQWFAKLKPCSINSFGDLSQAFMKQYSILIPRGESTTDLWNVKQTREESLRSFIDRFKAVASRLTISDESAIEILRKGLYVKGTYRQTLSTNPPISLEDALHRSTIYINLEEEEDAFNKQHETRPAISSTKDKAKETYREPRQHYDDKKGKSDANYHIRQEQQPLPWNKYIRPGGYVQPGRNTDSSSSDRPRDDRRSDSKDNRRSDDYQRDQRDRRDQRDQREGNNDPYCDFHKISGHSTSNCQGLQDELYKKYSRGEISDVTPRSFEGRKRDYRPNRPAGNADDQGRRNRRRQERPPEQREQREQRDHDRQDNPPAEAPKQNNSPKRRDVHVILGGLHLCEDSVRSIRDHQRRAESAAKNSDLATVNMISGSDLPIIFSKADLKGLHVPHNDPLVVTLGIGDCNVKRILVDNGSSVDVMFRETLKKMEVPLEDIKPHQRRLTCFDNHSVITVGSIKLPVKAGDVVKIVKFLVVDEASVYNVIMGTSWIHEMEGVASSYHQCMRFPSASGKEILTLRGNQVVSRSCFIQEIKLQAASETVHAIRDEITPNEFTKLTPRQTNKDLVEMIQLDPNNPEREVGIGSQLDTSTRSALEHFLKQNMSTFAWSIEDMTGIDPSIVSHELHADPTYKPVRQKRRKLGVERAQAVNDEVNKLLKAGSIMEVKYPEWLANPVVVKKKNGKWRVCVDFTDINKACPKDCFPLPHIDRLVEATAGNELLSFMDAFSGYNQIRMHSDDREKTAFITDRGTYCYKVMPFGLKNAGATYQRLVNKMFADQLGKTMEVYIDDMLVKSARVEDHIGHLQTCFEILNTYGMKLNPAKCTFGVTSGEFLGYIVTKRGIEANPKQIAAITKLSSPSTRKEVQRLTGRVAALNRFIARSTDRCLPFYQLLRLNKELKWNEQCEAAFQELKTYLATPPILAKPEDGETLYLYVAVSEVAVSGVLVKEELGEQRPIFYVSKTLEGAETRYPPPEKIAFAIVTAARKLRPYFQSHPITVLSDANIRTILHSPSQSGRLTKWAIELSEYDITYQPRKVLKSQVLADFLIDFPPETPTIHDEDAQKWDLHVDGASSAQGSGVGIRLRSPTGETLEQAFRLTFKPTNNVAEYEALIAGIRLARAVGVKHLRAHVDSRLVASQFSGEYEAKDERMGKYLALVQRLAKTFTTFELIKISRNDNKPADALAALATTETPDLTRSIPIELISTPSIEVETEEVCAITTTEIGEQAEPGHDWRTQIKDYIVDGKTPEDKWEARRLKARAARYTVINNALYRWSSSGYLLICIHGDEIYRVMAEIHEGAGGNHSGGRSLAVKIRKSGHFWPSMITDCGKFAAKCEKCQRHANVINSPTELLTVGAAPYPFMRWAMDVVGPLPPSHGKKYVLILTDYFTKWVEAEAYAAIQDDDVKKFLWKNIICRHGIPYEIVTDNGTNLTSNQIEGFCNKWKIKLCKSTPRYPQGNGQAEATNKTILDGLKKRLGKKKGLWADELDGVLWSHRTTPRRGTNRSPFSLCHGIEALAPSEANVYTLRRSELPQNPELNDNMLLDNLDEVEELRDQALLRIQNYQQSAAKYYNKKVHNRFFEEGDLVLRKVFENTKECNNKMGSKWEGPYLVSKVKRPGVYELMTMSSEPVKNSWNSINLKRYYY